MGKACGLLLKHLNGLFDIKNKEEENRAAMWTFITSSLPCYVTSWIGPWCIVIVYCRNDEQDLVRHDVVISCGTAARRSRSQWPQGIKMKMMMVMVARRRHRWWRRQRRWWWWWWWWSFGRAFPWTPIVFGISWSGVTMATGRCVQM